MEIQEIEVTIDNKGNVKIHVQGVQGDKCLEITKPLEEALGGDITSRGMIPQAGDPAQGTVVNEIHQFGG